MTKFFLTATLLVAMIGCSQERDDPTANSGVQGVTQDNASSVQVTKSQEWAGPYIFNPSEYPSWSIFITATKAGLINPGQGPDARNGILEEKYKIDVAVNYVDYDTCLQNYGNNTSHATCVTNGDVLNLALSRSTCVIMPTSTSAGADALCGLFNNLAELQASGEPVYGLEKSVAHFNFIRQIQKAGLDPVDFEFKHMDPEAAAAALQGNTGDGEVKAAALWNPFLMQALRQNDQVNRIALDSNGTPADSRNIPEEIVDMVVMDAQLASTPEGERFANLLCETFYMMSQKLSDPTTSEITKRALGQDFAKVPLEDMDTILRETSFYAIPQDGIKLFESNGFQNNMREEGVVVVTTKLIGALDSNKYPITGFNESSAQLNFSTKFMRNVSRPNQRFELLK